MVESVAALLCICTLLCSSSAISQTQWTVGGSVGSAANDATAGVAAGVHFETLEEAMARLRELRGSVGARVGEGFIIHLAAGVHRLKAPIVLEGTLKEVRAGPIVLMGPPDRSAVISGGVVLGDPARVSDKKILEKLSLAARVGVVEFDLRKAGAGEFGQVVRRSFDKGVAASHLELFFRGRPMPLARWPNDGYVRIAPAPQGWDRNRSFLIRDPNIARLAGERDLMAAGYWFHDWADETIPVESVDLQTGVVTLQAPGPRFGIKGDQRAFLFNAVPELDSPGEWYLDRASGVLYFWPPEPVHRGDIEVSVLPALVVTKDASDIRFSGITFEMARGHALIIQGGRNVVVDNATIRNVGGRAINAEGVGHRFSGLDVHDTGAGGVYVTGGDRQKLDPGGSSVEHSRFRRFNRLSRTFRPAIRLLGVGNRAIGNVISEGTYSAIQFSGNDHLIAFNFIFNVATETGDVGAIYTGRDWTGRGTVIRDNFLRDIHGPGLQGSRGVYLDDQASGIRVQRNLFVRVDQPIFIGGGRDNIVEDNLLVSSSPAVHVDARGLTWQKELTQDPTWQLRKRLAEVPFDRSPYRERYPSLASLLEDEVGAPKYNVIRRNVVVGGVPVRFRHGAERWVKVDGMVEAGPDTFVKGAAALQSSMPTDFRISPRAPAAIRAMEPLSVEGMECVWQSWSGLELGQARRTCEVR